MAITQSPAIIVETIVIDAPIEAVFAALSVPDQLERWWGSDDSHPLTAFHADVRPGGAWNMTSTNRDGEPCNTSGEYRTIDPPRLIESTWWHAWGDAQKLETFVRYELSEDAGSTTVTVKHWGFATSADRDDHAQGWPIVLRWLRDYVKAHS